MREKKSYDPTQAVTLNMCVSFVQDLTLYKKVIKVFVSVKKW